MKLKGTLTSLYSSSKLKRIEISNLDQRYYRKRQLTEEGTHTRSTHLTESLTDEKSG